MPRIVVEVMPKPEILDPQGKAVHGALPRLGFDGIAVALLGQYHPIGMAVGALLFAFLDYSSGALQLAGIEPEVVSIMKGTIMLTSVIAFTVVRRRSAAAEVRDAARRVEDRRSTARPGRAAPAGAPA